MDKKTLAVIGGGAAGHQIAYDLKAIFDVTLIDPKTYWEVPMAFPRLLVEPDALPARMDFASFLPGVRHVQGLATGMSATAVAVDTGHGRETISFDYAVIATGSRYLDPLIKAAKPSERERRDEIRAAHDRLTHARAVVVVGGGPVGVEVTAELRETFPALPVTLVHAAAALLDKAPPKFAGWAAAHLAARGADLILGDRVIAPALGEQPADGRVVLASGRVLAADTVIWAAGTTPLTDFVKASWPALVQPDGLVRTDGFLRLEGHANIFVVGDVTNLPEARMVIMALMHVASVVGNLKRLAAAAAPADTALKRYTPKIPGKGAGKLMILTLGRRAGLTSLPFGQFRAPFLARKIKAETMLVDKMRKAVGLDG